MPITTLAEHSINSGTFPSSWKTSNVVPIFKKHDKSVASNYRPISLLSCTSKIVERLVYNELFDFCLSNNLLSHKNSGFKRRDGTINQLINLTNKIYKGLDDSEEIAVIFLDLSKAFDRVCHSKLLYKLEKIGIRGKLFEWIRSYLSGRSQRVVYAGKTSEYLEIFASLPQGSILSPLFFLIYINDIEENIVCDISLFADDVSLMQTFKNTPDLENIINKDLETLNNWATQWNMDFNPAKSEMLIISNKKLKSKPRIVLKNSTVKQVTHHKHLGLHFSEDMKWSFHIDQTIKKVNKKLGLLRRQSHALNKQQRIDIYKTMIRPMLEYGSAIIDNCSTNDKVKLEHVQRTAALICTGAMRRTETKLLLDFLGWEDLSSRRKVIKIVSFYKIVNNLAPAYLIRNLEFNDNVKYSLRTSNYQQIKPKHCRLTNYKNSFFPECTKIWNSLPENVKKSDNICIFKKRINDYLSENSTRRPTSHIKHLHDGFFGSFLTHVKLNLSPLRAHLFKYNIIDNPFCPSCGDEIETAEHFFLDCKIYIQNRQKMLTNLFKLDPSLTLRNKPAIMDFIISGSSCPDKNQLSLINNEIFRHVKIYIATTKRFSD